MIGRLRGEVVELAEGELVLDVNGVGYEVRAGERLLGRLEVGETTTVVVSTQVKEDSITLYGFDAAEEKQAFGMLLDVKGVGPKVAMLLVGSLGLEALAQAVAAQDVRALTRVKGVGKTTAERVLLEFKRKTLPVRFQPGATAASPRTKPSDPAFELALARLGLRRSEIEEARRLLAREGLADAPTADKVKAALRLVKGGG